MCWVMPPASRSAMRVSRMASSSVVLPWSTWPMTVTTGARGTRSSGFDGVGLDLDHLLFEGLHLHVGAELARDHRRGLGVERGVDRHHHPTIDQLLEDVLDAHLELVREVLDGHALGERDAAGDRRRTGRHLRHDRPRRRGRGADRTARAAARTEAAARRSVARRRRPQAGRLAGRAGPGARRVGARTDRRAGRLIGRAGDAARAHDHRAAGNLRSGTRRRHAGRTRHRTRGPRAPGAPARRPAGPARRRAAGCAPRRRRRPVRRGWRRAGAGAGRVGRGGAATRDRPSLCGAAGSSIRRRSVGGTTRPTGAGSGRRRPAGGRTAAGAAAGARLGRLVGRRRGRCLWRGAAEAAMPAVRAAAAGGGSASDHRLGRGRRDGERRRLGSTGAASTGSGAGSGS